VEEGGADNSVSLLKSHETKFLVILRRPKDLNRRNALERVGWSGQEPTKSSIEKV